jgi:hypothetical protein
MHAQLVSVLVFILAYDYTSSADTAFTVLIHELLQVSEILEFFLVETVFSPIEGYLKTLFFIKK